MDERIACIQGDEERDEPDGGDAREPELQRRGLQDEVRHRRAQVGILHEAADDPVPVVDDDEGHDEAHRPFLHEVMQRRFLRIREEEAHARKEEEDVDAGVAELHDALEPEKLLDAEREVDVIDRRMVDDDPEYREPVQRCAIGAHDIEPEGLQGRILLAA